MKEYKPRFCKHCGKVFTPDTIRRFFCCEECKLAAKKAARKRYDERKRREQLEEVMDRNRQEPQFKPIKHTKPVISMDDILKYMYEHDCQYRQAVHELEGEY